MRALANINPKILQWARTTAAYSLEEASERTKIKPGFLGQWEAGLAKPTMAQVQKVAKLYHRPVGLLFLPEPPEEVINLKDFRRLPKQAQGKFSTALTFIVREVINRQQWMRDYLIEEGAQPLELIGKFSEKDEIKKVADYIRNFFDLNTADKKESPAELIQKIERCRVFVSRASFIHTRMPLSVEDVRGFASPDDYAPFIFINSADSENAQIFTIFHEIAHLCINAGGVSNFEVLSARDKESDNDQKTEYFCNAVAAEVLMPEDRVRSLIGQNRKFQFSQISDFGRQMGVSSLAFATRLALLDIISSAEYNTLRRQIEKSQADFLSGKSKKKKGGHPSPYLLQRNRVSKLFSNIVLSEYQAGRALGSEASTLLGVKLNNFKKYQKWLK